MFIHPSAIAPLVLPPKPQLPMMSPGETLALTVNLTKEQIAAGPHAHEDDPVTRDMESLLYDYYAWDPFWGASHFGGAALPNARIATCRRCGAARCGRRNPASRRRRTSAQRGQEFKGYYVHALDGDIGHVDNVLADDGVGGPVSRHRGAELVAGQVVQLSPYAVKDIDWFGEHINMNVSRDQVRSAPAWDPLAMVNESARNSCTAISAGGLRLVVGGLKSLASRPCLRARAKRGV